MTRVRRHFTADQKAEVVRRHLAGKEAVSTLAEELGGQRLSRVHGCRITRRRLRFV